MSAEPIIHQVLIAETSVFVNFYLLKKNPLRAHAYGSGFMLIVYK